MRNFIKKGKLVGLN